MLLMFYRISLFCKEKIEPKSPDLRLWCSYFYGSLETRILFYFVLSYADAIGGVVSLAPFIIIDKQLP